MSEGEPQSQPQQQAEIDAKAWIGRTLDTRYRLESVLGSGGFGHVFRAKHLILGRDVAIKVLQANEDADPTLHARFEREATTLAAVSHPNIVTVTDYGVEDGMPYLVMELVEGIDLRSLIDSSPLVPERAVGLTVQILRALGFAHERGIVHRDLKPGNVMVQSLGAEDHAKLLDFGFAKFFTDAPPGMQNSLTAAGTAFGTPGYIAPEQLSSQPIDQRADLFAVGVILFEMVVGRRPFKSEHPLEELRATLKESVPKMSALRKELADDPLVEKLDAVVVRAMSKEPSERYASAGEMISALAPLIGQRASSPVEPTPKAIKPGAATGVALVSKKKKKGGTPWALYGIGAVGVLALAVLGIVWAAHLGGDDETVDLGPGGTAQDDVADPLPSPELSAVILGPAIGDRPAWRDPWRSPVPEDLKPLRDKLDGGEALSAAEVHALQRRGRTVTWDSRSWLLLGRSHVIAGAPFAAVHAYEKAYNADPSCRGDVRMLRDLLGLVLDRRAGAPAADLVVDVYRAEALPAVDRAIGVSGGEPEAKTRFEALRARLAGDAGAARH